MEFIRRFGLEHCDLPTMIENVGYLLRTSAVNIERKYTQRIPIIFCVITILTGACYFYVFVGSMIWFVFIRCRETGDYVAASIIFSITSCGLSGVVKLIYIRFYNDTVKDIVQELLACDSFVEPGTRFSANLLKSLKNVKKRAVWFWLFLTFNALIAIAIILPGRHFIEDLLVIYGLEPMFVSPNYEIAFTLMAAGAYFGVLAETNVSALIITLVGYAEARILALSDELDNLWNDTKAYYQVFEDVSGTDDDKPIEILNKYVRKQLHDIVKKHVMSINFLGRVDNLFQGVMAIEFGLVASGLIAELLGGLENTYFQLPYTLLQVSLDCFIGQRLLDASLILENAVYCCKWEYFDKSNQRTVYFMLMNSQKTLTLSVGGLTILSFSCLMSVLNSTYSAYTTLRSRM